MHNERYQATALWKRTLGPQKNDANEPSREVLRTALATMRKNVIPFARQIHRDVLGLTVHDESHLDALWETAEEVAGPDFTLNPLEAFVFGAAVLLHDTAMAVAAYPGGLEELRSMEIWKDTEAYAKSFIDNEDSLQQYVLFNVLRNLHAKQAEKLASFTFSRKSHNEAIPLLENTELRDALGAIVGSIAHSHHWDPSKLLEEFNTASGAPPEFPPDWTLNEIKVACLLRCADATHLDARRAPTMLFAISTMPEESRHHWEFQNRLNKVTRQGEKLVFNSGRPFEAENAQSWWLCYETLQMVDRELKSSNAILEEIHQNQFAAKSVAGIESPTLLAKHVRVAGWKPINAEVNVGDPVRLARTLGGRDLYGSNQFAPIRELVQNATDAIRARRSLEDRADDWGEIRVTLQQPKDDQGDIWLHVDDNGTGMSERVLTGSLIDFGNSLWSSQELQDEFPGLRQKGNQTVGKFGIGFFSSFLLGDSVKVTSRKFTEGSSDAKTLIFDGLVRRPLLRQAVTGELPPDFSTRVSVKLNEVSLGSSRRNEHSLDPRKHLSATTYLRRLIAALDIRVRFSDEVKKEAWVHDPKWTEVDPEVFLQEIYGNNLSNLADDSLERLRLLSDAAGKIYGRAAFPFKRRRRGTYTPDRCMVSVGGFVTEGEAGISIETGLPSMVGVLAGEAESASRNYAHVNVPDEIIAKWATEQAGLIDVSKFRDVDLLSGVQELKIFGAETGDLPFCFIGGKISGWNELESVITESDELLFPVEHSSYQCSFNLRSISDLHGSYFSSSVKSNLISLEYQSRPYDFLDEEDRRRILKEGVFTFDNESLDEFFQTKIAHYVLQTTRELWGVTLKATLLHGRIDKDEIISMRPENWLVKLERDR